MSNEASKPHESDALEWAQLESKKNLPYWQDRQKNGNGLIQQIADFVLNQAAGQG